MPGAQRGSAGRAGPAAGIGRHGGAPPPGAAPVTALGRQQRRLPPARECPPAGRSLGGPPPSRPPRPHPPSFRHSTPAPAGQTLPNCSEDTGDRQRSRRQRRDPLLPRPRPRGEPATPHRSPPTRSLAAAVPTSPGRPAETPPGPPPQGPLRTLGAAPRPPLPAAERPLPRPCASAGAGAGRGAVAAREEG